MTPLDAFNFGLDRIIKASDQAVRNCEDKRLDPPADPTIDCYFCEAKGYYPQRHCAGRDCNFLKKCPCPCRSCAYIECDTCNGSGELSEPEEFQNDAYWEAAWDRAKEARESEGAP